MVYSELKEIHGRKYVYERTSYRPKGDKRIVRHKNKYIGALVKVYKTSKRYSRRIINSIVRQIRNPYNKKNTTFHILFHMVEQLNEDIIEYWKKVMGRWKRQKKVDPG